MFRSSFAAPVISEGSTTSAAQDQEQKQQEEQQPKDEVLHRLPGHALTLAVHSEYFKPALSQRWRKEGGGKVRSISKQDSKELHSLSTCAPPSIVYSEFHLHLLSSACLSSS